MMKSLQQSIGITLVPQPIEAIPSLHTQPIDVPMNLIESQHTFRNTPIAITNPEPMPIPFSLVPPIVCEQSVSTPNHELQQIESNDMEKVPCINPNFSKIIELSVTPSPPPITEVDESLENECAEDSPAKSFLHQSPELHNVDPIEPKIPLSHLIATNQYPSLNRIPPANIVQSFPPVYTPLNVSSEFIKWDLWKKFNFLFYL